MDYYKKALEEHKKWKGKLKTELNCPLETKEDLSLAYTPGVAEPCRRISENNEDSYEYTGKGNTVAIISDGSAVLGLGNIGPHAAMPVMEGKAALFRKFGGLNSVPIVIDTQDTEEIIKFVKQISPTFGGINLEDISAPRCVEIERKLKEELDIPIFHDDQHGTAIVTTAALINTMRLTGKKPEDLKVVISGVGAAGSSIIRMIKDIGITHILAFGRKGIIRRSLSDSYDFLKKEIAEGTNPYDLDITMGEAMKDADVFIGVSSPGVITGDMVKTMAKDSAIFAMANPEPEIGYEEALENGVRIMGTGRSDFPNQVNNVLAFPGLFKGALMVRAKAITDEMKMAAAEGIANLISDEELKEDYIIPGPFDERVPDAVAHAVADMAVKQNLGGIRK